MSKSTPNDDNPKPGPRGDRLKLEGDWKEAIGKAIRKPKPKGGWPKP